MNVESKLKAYAEIVDAQLNLLIPPASARPAKLFEAMRYSCLSPGKRMRPALCMASCEAVGGRAEEAVNVAAAIEMVHCFSLIHDDLPALDDDVLRRGRPTCHVEFGEAVAILAGDALFSHAFVTLAAPPEPPIPPAAKAGRYVAILATAAGVDGVVAGEVADILAEGQPMDASLLEYIHSRKTAALISASCELGAVAGTDDAIESEKLRLFGARVGLAFQIADDILDETSTDEQLGKTAGADRARGKATYPALFGLDASRAQACALVDDALGYLSDLPGQTDFLSALARFSIARVR